MRTHKRGTNTTFTHDAERRDDRRTQDAAPEPTVCAGCGAVFTHQRWTHSASARSRVASAGGPIDVRICAACRQRTSHVPHGFVHVDGDFVCAHRAEIVALLEDEAARAAEDNPVAQIIDWYDNGHRDDVLITTTTDQLAVRLGRALEKAFEGRVRYGFSDVNKLAHVWWHRDAA